MAKFLNNLASDNSQTLSKSKINIYDTIPKHILADSENFITLLQDYYEFLNEKGMPIHTITNMVKNTDIDRADAEFIDNIMAETMVDLPFDPQANRKIFYKRVVDFYRTKGTIESFRIFFRVFYNDNIELFYPKDSTFTLGQNRWDAELRIPDFDENGILVGYTYGGWVNNQGMLSTTQYLTDGRYYQPYSYVIKSSQNISKWQYVFNKVCHPSGFVFYGEIAIFIELLDTNDNLFRIPTTQPGFTRPSELVQKIIIELLKDTPYTETIELHIRKILTFEADFRASTNTISDHFMNKYFSLTDISQYYQYDVTEIDTAENLPGTIVGEAFFVPPIGLGLEDGGSLETEDGIEIDTEGGLLSVELTDNNGIVITTESGLPIEINLSVRGFSNGFGEGFG